MKFISPRNIAAVVISMMMPYVSHAALVLDSTRIIYPESVSQASVKVENPSDLTFLAQAWIENEKGQEEDRFTVYPPLARLNAQTSTILRLEKIDNSQLPDDRETMMWLNVKEIPKSQPTAKQQLVVAFKTRIKLFYRPKKIDPEMHNAFQRMTWSQMPGKLTVKNPTPYHIVFNKVVVTSKNNKKTEVAADMVNPFSSLSLSVPAGEQVSAVEFDIINDFGGISDTQKISL